MGNRLSEGISVTDAPEHLCERPSWQCRVCGHPWPCEPARASLADGADRVMLALYMWGHLDRAVTELPPGPPTEMFDRFLRWTDVDLAKT